MKHPLLSGLLLSAACVLSACSDSTDKLSLHVFECGEIEVRDVSLFSPGVDQGQKKNMVDSCYLIQHKNGKLIWDAGLNDALGVKGTEAWEGKFFMNVPKTLSSQLDEIQIKPEEITHLAISHFHGDHTGNANMFKQAALLIQQAEYDAAFGPTPEKFGFPAENYNQVDKTKIQILNGEHDVFGDGSVIIKPAPGHTPGHQMLLVNLKDTGLILLSGDLYHFTKNREHKRVPLFNFDKEQTLESMEHIEAFVKESGAQFWIQHDKEQNANIKHSPDFYQ